MKKLWIPMVLLLLLLAACMSIPEGETAPSSSTPSSSTPSSSSITPPSSSVVPSSSTVPTTPTSKPLNPDKTGRAVVYTGSQSSIGIDLDCSGCTVGHLYWVDSTIEKITPILEEPVSHETQEGDYVYYVKTTEPTKIYRTPIGEFSQHEMIYESSHGEISYMMISVTLKDILQFVADEKRFVVFDMRTGESTVLMEQYHIDYGYMFGTGDGVTWANEIWFLGRPTENDPPYGEYYYYRDSGRIEVDDSL